MSLAALLFPFTALLLVLTLLTGSKELLDESDPLLLRSHQGIATSFVLLRLLKPLFMSVKRLPQFAQSINSSQSR
jgi:fumarate reductase subunit D